MVPPNPLGRPDQNRPAVGAHGPQRDPKTGLFRKTTEVVFWVSSLNGPTAEQWNETIRGHWRIENGSHYVRDTAFAEDASRIRKNPDIAARLRSFAYNLLRDARCDNIKNARWRAALDINYILANRTVLRTKQSWRHHRLPFLAFNDDVAERLMA